MAQTNIDINLLFNEGKGLDTIINKMGEVKRLQEEINNANVQVQGSNSTAQVKALTDEIARLNAELKKVKAAGANAGAGVAGGAAKAARTIGDLRARQKELRKEINATATSNTKRLKELNAEFQEIGRNIKKLTTIGKKDFNTFGNALKSFGFKFNVLANIVSRTTSVAIQGFRQLVRGVTESILSFDQAQADLSALLGKTRAEISQLTTSAKELGATTAFTATQVAQLQLELSKLGFTTDEILDAQEGIIGLATAFNVDVARAAEIAGSTIRGFALEASDAQRVSDVLAKSFSESALNLEKFAVAGNKVAPLAAKLGVSFEATTAILGKLSDAGFDASTAGTALRNILVFLGDESSKLSQAIGEPVRSTEDLVKGLFKLKQEGLSLNEVFELSNRRTVAPLAALIGLAPGVDELTKSLEGAAGTTAEFQDKQLNTISGQVTLLKSAWDGFILSLEDGNGEIAKTTKNLTRVVAEIFNLAAGLEKAEDDLTAVEKKTRETAETVISLGKSLFGVVKIILGARGLAFAYRRIILPMKAFAAQVTTTTARLNSQSVAANRSQVAFAKLTKAAKANSVILKSLAIVAVISFFQKLNDFVTTVADSVEELTDGLLRLKKVQQEAFDTTGVKSFEEEIVGVIDFVKLAPSRDISEIEAEIEAVKELIKQNVTLRKEAQLREPDREKFVREAEREVESLNKVAELLRQRAELEKPRAERLQEDIDDFNKINRLLGVYVEQLGKLGPKVENFFSFEDAPFEDPGKTLEVLAIIEDRLKSSAAEIAQSQIGLSQAVFDVNKRVLGDNLRFLEEYLEQRRALGGREKGIIETIDEEIKDLKLKLNKATLDIDIKFINQQIKAREDSKKEIIASEILFLKNIENLRVKAEADAFKREQAALRNNNTQSNRELERKKNAALGTINDLEIAAEKLVGGIDTVTRGRIDAQRSIINQLDTQIDLNDRILDQKLLILEVDEALRNAETEKSDILRESQLKARRDLAETELARLKADRTSLKSFRAATNEQEIARKKERNDLNNRSADLLTQAGVLDQRKTALEAEVQTQKDLLQEAKKVKDNEEVIADLKEAIKNTNFEIKETSVEITENQVQQEKTLEDIAAFYRKIEVERRKDIADATALLIDLSTQAADTIFDTLKRTSELREELAAKQLQVTENNIDRQQRLAEKGLENTLAFERKRSQQLQKIQADEARRQANIDKTRAFFNLLASYAQAGSANALGQASKDITLAEIFAANFPKFEQGGVVGEVVSGGSINNGILQGNRHSQGGVIIEAEKDEAILSRKHMSVLGVDGYHALTSALDSGASLEFGNQSKLLALSTPILKADNSGLEREIRELQNIVRNKPVSNSNIDNAGNVITTDIENGFKRITKKLRKKPRIK